MHDLWSHRVIDVIAIAAAVYGLYVCLALFAVAVLRSRPRNFIIPFVLGAIAAGALDWLAGLLYHDQRPFVAMGITPLVPHDADNGFPSDHSAAAAYIATMTWAVDRRLGVAAWAVAVALGAGRIFCLLHGPIDVIGGWVIGALPAALAILMSRASRRV